MRHQRTALLLALCVIAPAGCDAGGGTATSERPAAGVTPSQTVTTSEPTSEPSESTSPSSEPTSAPSSPAPPSEPAPATSEPTPAPSRPAPSPSQPPPPPSEPAPAPAPSETDDGPLESGDTGPEVLALQHDLSALGYWLGSPDGEFGDLTEQAVLALQGVAGLGRDGVAGPKTLTALGSGTRLQARSSGDAVEIDLDRGLIVFVSGGEVSRALHTSTGTFEECGTQGRIADTPRGSWEVTWSHDGWRTSDLGRLYRPRYFTATASPCTGTAACPPTRPRTGAPASACRRWT